MGESRVTREVEVTNRAGIHTRPASMLVRAAAKYKADFFIYKDGYEINGKSIIGVMTLAAEQGLTVQERRVSIEDWQEGARTGEIREVFACGTAAVVTPVARLAWDGGEVTVGTGEPGPVTMDIRRALVDLQYGRVEDRHGWMHKIC